HAQSRFALRDRERKLRTDMAELTCLGSRDERRAGADCRRDVHVDLAALQSNVVPREDLELRSACDPQIAAAVEIDERLPDDAVGTTRAQHRPFAQSPVRTQQMLL